MITPSKTSRRPLKFKTPAELNAELDRLRTGSYKKLGKWNLHQACRHLAATIEGSLTPAQNDVPTPEESAMKEKFWGMIMSPEGMPEQLPIGNPALVPPDDCTDAEIDRLKNAFQTLATLPHRQIKVGRCGPVPVAEVAHLHLMHCAHHLSFLDPVDDRRQLSFNSAADVKADVQQLRKGYKRLGNWNLRQICRHLTVSTTNTLKPATGPATPEQAAVRPILEKVLSTGKIPTGLQAPAPAQPPEDCTDADVDAFLATLDQFENYNEPTAHHPRFGPLNQSEYKKIVLAHMAHHLSHLIPSTQD